MNQHFLEKCQIVVGGVPVALNTAGITGDVVSMKNFGRCAIVFIAAAGTAGDDPTLTVEQCKSVAASNAKALNFTRVDTKQGTLTAIGQFTKVTQAAANTYTDATSAEVQKLWVVDVKSEDLDADNGYDCIRASIGDVGTNAQLGTLLYILHEPRYAADPLPSAIVD